MRLKSFWLFALPFAVLGPGEAAFAHEARMSARRPPVAVRVAPAVPRVHLSSRPHGSSVIVHGAFGPAFGLPYGYPLYGPVFHPYGYVAPPMVVLPAQPPTYIEQGGAAASTPAQGFWYWCTRPEGYYPDVPECPDGWQAVPPRPDGQ